MGNYHNIEREFVERTLQLIDQYYEVLDHYPFEEQFNYTLTINCLLGLIVMPKERVKIININKGGPAGRPCCLFSAPVSIP
jgi:hypothetical protein